MYTKLPHGNSRSSLALCDKYGVLQTYLIYKEMNDAEKKMIYLYFCLESDMISFLRE